MATKRLSDDDFDDYRRALGVLRRPIAVEDATPEVVGAARLAALALDDVLREVSELVGDGHRDSPTAGPRASHDEYVKALAVIRPIIPPQVIHRPGAVRTQRLFAIRRAEELAQLIPPALDSLRQVVSLHPK